MRFPYTPVAERAGHRCEYCRAPEAATNFAFPVDHVMPRVRAPELLEDLENLALACPACNWHKAARTDGVDPESGETVMLFHPRRDVWSEHFAWAEPPTVLVGRSPIGRATIGALHMNAPAQRSARAYWLMAGGFP